MVARTRLNVTSYVHCLSSLLFSWLAGTIYLLNFLLFEWLCNIFGLMIVRGEPKFREKDMS
jgi:hypothetical protein